MLLLHCDAAGERFVVVGVHVLRESARRVRDFYGLRTDVDERHRQVKCCWDLTRFHSTSWNLVASQTVLFCLTYRLLQVHLLEQGHQSLNRRTRPTSPRLLPDGDRVIIYLQPYFGCFTLLEHTEMLLRLEGKAQRRALAKTRRLMQDAASRPAGGAAGGAGYSGWRPGGGRRPAAAGRLRLNCS